VYDVYYDLYAFLHLCSDLLADIISLITQAGKRLIILQ